jgi:hypothetical protein
MKDEAFAWLKDNDLGDIIQETVNSNTLSAQAKLLLEDKGLDMDPELFNTYWQNNVSKTKAK